LTLGTKTKFLDTKGAIRSCKSMKDRQHSGQKKNDKGPSSDLHKTTQQTKDRATRTPPLKTGGEVGALEG
jgi:hypothetical protein